MNSYINAETILVVDDRESLRDIIETILVLTGYHVLKAASGADALQIARTTPEIDLLVTDIEMPGMTGDKLAARFSKYHPSAAIMFVSSSGRPVKVDGPFEFLAKPFGISGLREKVRAALTTRPVRDGLVPA